MVLFYVILSLLGLGLLVFIHELGHYFMALRSGMRVEVFSIGLGKPILSWQHKGVKWQLCPLLFGGYVRIAGMEPEQGKEPHEIPGGFYSKSPWVRIKVALAGPLTNLLFTLLIFSVLWISGGRIKTFSQFTRLIGSVDQKSELYRKGVRPGDELLEYNGKPFRGFDDLVYASIVNGRAAELEGNKIDYFTQEKVPYEYTLVPYESAALRQGMKTVGIMAPANYLIYRDSPLFGSRSPMAQTGIQDGDQIVWADGQLVFSTDALSGVLNAQTALIHYEREGHLCVAKVPRIKLRDLRLTETDREELKDWGHEVGLSRDQEELLYIPYVLNARLVVEKSIAYLTDDSQVQIAYSPLQNHEDPFPLRYHDRIVAIDGMAVQDMGGLVQALQTRNVQMIVKREQGGIRPISWQEEDRCFTEGSHLSEMLPIIQSLGTGSPRRQSGNFHLLKPIVPMKRKELLALIYPSSLEKASQKTSKQKAKIQQGRENALSYEQIEQMQNRYVLGAALQDRSVIYNPDPFSLFFSVFEEMMRNLLGLISGYLSPKYLGGPLMIVQVMHQSWTVGLKEALFWLGAVSMNLGILNLLPIPVLDGGHIFFSCIEAIRRKPIPTVMMRRMVMPFVFLLIGTCLYLTYYDLVRLLERFF